MRLANTSAARVKEGLRVCEEVRERERVGRERQVGREEREVLAHQALAAALIFSIPGTNGARMSPLLSSSFKYGVHRCPGHARKYVQSTLRANLLFFSIKLLSSSRHRPHSLLPFLSSLSLPPSFLPFHRVAALRLFRLNVADTSTFHYPDVQRL